MRLVSQRLWQFRSYVANRLFKFPKGKGLFLIRGENGEGKSTMWDGVSWTLFGKTLSGLSGPAVETWETRGGDGKTLGESKFYIGTELHTITRTRKPITLKHNGKPCTQAHIDSLLGMTYSMFLPVALCGQSALSGQPGPTKLFLDMKPGDRLTTFSEILDLGVWLDASARAKEKINEATFITDELERQLDKNVELRKQAKADLEAANERGASWKDEQVARRDGLILKMNDHRNLAADANTKAEKARDQEQRIEGLETAAMSVAKEYKQQIDELIEKRAEVQGRKNAYSDAVRRAEKRLSAVTEDEGADCPTCGQEVNGLRLDAMQREINKGKDAIGREVVAIEQYNDAIRSIEAEGKRAGDEVRAHRTERADWLRKLGTWTRNKEKAEQSALSIKEQVEQLDETVNPHGERVKSLKKRVSAYNKAIKAQKVELKTHKAEADVLAEWPKRFKEIRLWLVESALTELEMYCNSTLSEMGLGEWSMTFAVERETGSGTISRGFEVYVQSPDSPERVTWLEWSGGEKQRLRVAGAIGLASLVRARVANAPVFEMWDEPTNHLSDTSKAGLLDMMKGRAGMGQQVWMVDHRTLDSGMFDAEYQVVKNSIKGSRLSLRKRTTS